MKHGSLLKRIRPAVLWMLAIAVLIGGALYVGAHDRAYTQQSVAYVTRSDSASLYGAESADMMMEEAAYDAGANMASGSSITATASTKLAAQSGRKLVRTADLTLSTAAYDASVEKINAALEAAEGYVENLYQYGESNTRRLSLLMRVPSEQLDAFLSSLAGAGRVTSRSESTEDMTASYQDNEARLTTLYAKRDRLNELLLKAEDVSDLIEIESAIADTQYQIDSYETSQRSIDRQVDMSAVSVTLMEKRPMDSAQADVPMDERIRAAFAASVEWLGEFLRDLVVFIVMLLPVAVPLAAVAVVILFIRKRKGK